MLEKDLEKAISETLASSNLDADKTSVRKLSKPLNKQLVDERLVMYHRPQSIEAEYFRFLRSRIEHYFNQKGEQREGRIIQVTGPSLGAGKTSCALNLGLAFARSYGSSTLFLDADSRRSSSEKYLGLGLGHLPGLVDVLTMKTRAGSVLINTGMSDMVYFPAGSYTDTYVDSMRNQEIMMLLGNLKRHFKYIIIDSPPAFPMPEPAILARYCDGTLIVLKAGKDGINDLYQTREALGDAPILGVILNGVKNPPGQRYGAYGYYGKDVG